MRRKHMSISKEELKKYIDAYNTGNALITDEEYDRLLEEYISEHGESSRPYLRQKQSSAINSALSTLPKVYGVRTAMRENQKTFVDWLKKIKDEDRVLIPQPKFDGVSIAFDVKAEKLFTRGDFNGDETSMDVTDKLGHFIPGIYDYIKRAYQCIPESLISVKFECIMDTSTYLRRFKDTYKTARAAASAIITGVKPEFKELSHALTLVPLRFVHSDGQQLTPSVLPCVPGGSFIRAAANDPDSLIKIELFIESLKSNLFTYTVDEVCTICDIKYLISDTDINPYVAHCLRFDVDGCVVSSFESHQGKTDIYTKDEVAIKIKHDVQTTKLIGIEWCYGLNGALTPDAILGSVAFGNVKVSRASLSNADLVRKMDLHVDDTVEVMYNIVPYIVRSYHDGNGESLQPPTHCPKCGCPLNISNKIIRCTNDQCEGRIIGRIYRYAKTLGMFGVGQSTIQFLYDNKLISDVPDLYNIDTEKLATMEGWSSISVNNLINSIKNASSGIPLEKFLGAMPILNVSTSVWKNIFKNDIHDEINTLLELGYSDKFEPRLETFKNFENMHEAILNSIQTNNIDRFITCMNLCKFRLTDDRNIIVKPVVVIDTIIDYLENTPLWKLMRDCFVNVTIADVKKYKGKVCLSGTRNQECKEYLESKGYEVVDNHSKDVSMLIIPDPRFTSVKVTKARKQGIPIYTLQNYKENIQ